ncbi:zf-HC2 domain-containing protein [Alkalicoccobacillus porphyridii]|uniref:Zf-HC2 domain-containing protein n=1 Tax=Alkalicoccobacillus porphyridii TaxID=2597270 RepID=A0A553ZWV8_9BACI|nr:zf-HC2 domain-containing protein [Alkalicoccobacillus porphyridii]TSB45875.1 zf-HC2 domain-containing protein [Alkalicoccobacillus porphyridii]
MNENKVKCEIIKDVLPLYIDGVVSLETKSMVEDHLLNCEKCKQEYEELSKEVVIPPNIDNSMLKHFKENFRKKKIKFALVASLITAMVFMSVYWFVFNFERVIPYSNSLFSIDTDNNNQIYLHYSGNNYYGTHEAYSIPIEINGVSKNVSFIYFTQTLAESPSSTLLGKSNETETVYQFSESDQIDAIYYVDFDTDLTNLVDDGESIVERAELLWEK